MERLAKVIQVGVVAIHTGGFYLKAPCNPIRHATPLNCKNPPNYLSSEEDPERQVHRSTQLAAYVLESSPKKPKRAHAHLRSRE